MIPLAVAAILTPAWAAAAMAGSIVSVVANALRLRRYRRRAPGGSARTDRAGALEPASATV